MSGIEDCINEAIIAFARGNAKGFEEAIFGVLSIKIKSWFSSYKKKDQALVDFLSVTKPATPINTEASKITNLIEVCNS